jgi:hypothetical protein
VFTVDSGRSKRNRRVGEEFSAALQPNCQAPLRKIFSFYFWLILTDIWQQPTSLALVLDRCGARHEYRKDQTPKPVTFSARNGIGSRRATE